MLLAEDLTTLHWLLLGTVLVCAIFVMRRSAAPAQVESAAEEDDEAPDHELSRPESRTAGHVVNLLEARLYDFVRETEARMETRIAQMNQLIAETDREIVRLSDLLKSRRDNADSRGPDVMRFGLSPNTAQEPDSWVSASSMSPSAISAAKEQMVLHLHGAGFSVPEIAHMVGHSPEEVQAVLKAA